MGVSLWGAELVRVLSPLCLVPIFLQESGYQMNMAPRNKSATYMWMSCEVLGHTAAEEYSA